MNFEEPAPSAGQHYSGRNRVPNIHEFMQQLDRQKKDRDTTIDEQLKQNRKRGDIKQHKNDLNKTKDTRSVRDPVTGKDVAIRDADMDFKDAVDNPQV